MTEAQERHSLHRAADAFAIAAGKAQMATLEAFLATLSPVMAGRARKSLEKQVRTADGIMRRSQFVEALNAKGYMLRTSSLGELRLYAPDDVTFYDAFPLTTFGLSYAKFLGA